MSTLFYQLLLLPFFAMYLYRIYKKRYRKGELSGLMYILIPILFFTIAAFVETRYIIQFLPLVVIFSIRELFEFRKRKWFLPLFGLILMTSAFMVYDYTTIASAQDHKENLSEAVEYIIANSSVNNSY